MSLSTARSFLSEAGYGEQELDANSALMELDKGVADCRVNSASSAKAVVLFPKLFQKYPFPILINSAFLKLADIFRLGNNFLRLCVLKVTQQSEKHLEKILNVDEFMKRVFSVIHSNDPVARAITLRMLGSLASIIPDRKNAHHSIRQSLDSHDNVEVEAAIYAAASFSAQSKWVPAGLDTPVDLKLKLIPMLQHMHHNASLASGSRELLQHLVNCYPSTPMVIVTLHTFTQLAASSLIDIPKQLQLLLQYLKDDPRKATLCECALNSPYSSLKLGMLAVLSTLSGTIAIKQYFNPMMGSASAPPRLTDLVKLAQECCYHSNLAVAAHGVVVLTNIRTLTSLVCLLKSRPHLNQSAVEFLLGQLQVSCDEARALVCHALAAIASQLQVVADGMLGPLVELYRVAGHSSSDMQQELLVSLATVIFVASQKSLSAEVKLVIKQQLQNVANGWTVYRIARQASRMGCHDLSSELYQSLRTRVASEHFYFWLNSLKEFSQAEQCLSHVEKGDYSAAMTAIAEALRSYQKGVASLTMKVSMDEFKSLAARYRDLHQSSFDADYATLRNVELYP
ncbi:hypothetical protein CRUP_022767 [Coryphaenoides rupestris]|nr:hypothetical protein CRUP_022767 [Coryphaenoides rupestris]